MARRDDKTVNYAAPGAHVGLQVDGDVVITGGLFMGDSKKTRKDADDDAPGDVVAVQAAKVWGKRKRS